VHGVLERRRTCCQLVRPRWLRIVYNWRDDTRLEGRTLIGIGPDEGTLVSLLFAGLGLLFAGLLIYGLARRRKKKPVERGG
jgi:hypothetical protein